jgi:isoleucyl-tRNA synthetase
VLDVWFDSGSTCRAVLEQRPELGYPADVYLEGSDQHRGWFNASLMVGVATKNEAPYRQVITHGWMLDEQGRAMSKSKGTGVAPMTVIEQYGADVLRLWVASTNYFEDVRFGPNILKQTAESYRKIRNTLRYLLAALGDFEPGTHTVAPDQLTELDRWALHTLQNLIDEVTRGYETYEFQRATRAISDFCTVEMSSFYLDVLKDRLYASAPDDHSAAPPRPRCTRSPPCCAACCRRSCRTRPKRPGKRCPARRQLPHPWNLPSSPNPTTCTRTPRSPRAGTCCSRSVTR